MKKYCFLLLMSVFTFSFNGFSQLKVDSYGKVGINTSPYSARLNVNCGGSIDYNGALIGGSSYSNLVQITGTSLHAYELYVGGEAYCTSSWQSSDELFKKNIQKLDGIDLLNKLKKIEGKKYEFKNKAELELILKKDKNDSLTTIPNFPEGEHYGLIAQEIEGEFPELVKYDSISMTRAINYDGMIPILLEALKAQQTQIEELQGQIDDCCKSTKSAILDGSYLVTETEEARLYQNTPNPFSTQTTIQYEIPETIQTAQLHICNMTGTLLKTITANQRGSGSVIISANEFTAGMYLYSLVCNGKIVDTKQMLLTE